MSTEGEDGSEPDIGTSWWYCSWVITAVGLLWFISFLWMNRSPHRVNPQHDTSTCKSRNCARCQVLASFESTQRLRHRCERYFETSDASSVIKSQICCLVEDSVERKNDILTSVYEESGYEPGNFETSPLIWMCPGLERQPFWRRTDGYLHSLVSTLESPTTFQAIKKEFTCVNKMGKGWKTNSVPTGKWRVYSLQDQGSWVDENTALCPITTQLLKDSPICMHRHVFGNAMFSVLEPGSRIEAHTGPCNYRLRCHFPLITSPDYRLKVGRTVTSWQEGELVVFDDSFVHEVWHEGSSGDIDGGRTVLIFDIWHPSVTADQRSAIEYIFA